MSDVDARVRKTLGITTERLDGGSLEPRRVEPSTDVKVGAKERAKTPGSNNPPPEALSVKTADEARDVAAKLDTYNEELLPKPGTTARQITLTEALRQAQMSAPEYLTSEEDYIFSAIRVLAERHLWTPILSNVTSAGISGQGTAGNFQTATNVLNTLQVSQRLPYGGQVAAQWIWEATDQLREQSTGGYEQSSALVLSGQVPLLRGAGYIAQESLIQDERSLIYEARNFETFRRDFAVRIARDYFALLESKSRLENQRRRVELLESITAGERARYEAGRIAEFNVNRAENDLLNARASLASQREQYIVDVEQFKIRLGIQTGVAIDIIEQELDLPEPDVSLDAAMGYALEYRLDLQTRRDQVDDAKRSVANAKNGLLPDLNLNGNVRVPTDPRDATGGLSPSLDDTSYSASVSLGLPLDRYQERLNVRQQTIELERAQREYGRFRDSIAVEARQSVRRIDLARFQLNLAERQVEINRRRVRETELKADLVETREKVDAANELQEAENARDRARTALRNAVLDYLRLTGQLRIARDGTFVKLPGMTSAPAAPEPAIQQPDAPPPAEPAPAGG